MKPEAHLRVASPPAKPLMIFDGDCHFCRRWIERWRQMTRGQVEYVESQEGSAQFPEIPEEEFGTAVQLIETDGKVYRAAEAVFRSLRYARGAGWSAWCYDRVPGFAAVTEGAYALIARNRVAASALSRALWGEDVRRPTYLAARRGFLRTLGLCYLFAFISLWVQLDGLMSSRGLLPAEEMMGYVRASPSASFWQVPTALWWGVSDSGLHALCAVGTLAAALLTLGLVPWPALLVCFAGYLSLILPGGVFFSYQWDILLLETGFVAMFLAPWQWRLRRGSDGPVSGAGLFLAKALLFKIMFMSGVVKLTSGDTTWFDLTALNYHYWTQPLPTALAWFSEQAPLWVKQASVAVALFIEIAVPFFIWAPRRLRLAAAWLLIILQVGIALTGNYCFFNLTVVALCLLLFDDASWRESGTLERPRVSRGRWLWVPATIALLATLPLNAWHVYSAYATRAEMPRWLQPLATTLDPFRIANGYGLFRVMTQERPEIIFEGSSDAFDWVAYEFKFKPGDVQRAPQWNAPHQPRLDWSMWFAALGSQRDRAVAERLVAALLRNEPAVLDLLAANPFPEKPPRYVRASVYEYRFTNWEERRATGAWWKRKLRRQYIPTVSAEDLAR